MNIQIAKSSATGSASGRRTSLSLSQKSETKVNRTRMDDSVKEIRHETPSPTNALNSDPDNSKKNDGADMIGIKQDNHVLLSTKEGHFRDGEVEEENTQTNGHKSQMEIAPGKGMDPVINDMEMQKGKIDPSKNSGKQEGTQMETNTECNDESYKKEGKSKEENNYIENLKTNTKYVTDSNEEFINVYITDKSIEAVLSDVADLTTTIEEKCKSGGASMDNNNKSEEHKINVVVEPERNRAPVSDKVMCKSATSSVRIIRSSVSTNDCDKLSNTSDDEDMECLVVDSEVEIPRPSTPGKILKLKTLPPTSSSCKTAEITINRTVGASPSISSRNSILDSNTSTPITDHHFTSALRTISGRRSLRPLSELSFRNSYREHYRTINTELNANTSSLNVTVGSEVPNVSTSSFLNRGKKRERIDVPTNSDTQIGIGCSPKSPKRPRLNISGLLDVVKTPISILRSRFSKTGIRSSTPNTKPIQKEVEDGVENVSVIESEEAVEKKTEVNIGAAEISIKNAENDEVKYVEIKAKSEQNLAKESKEQQQIETVKNIDKKSTCLVM